MSVVGLSRRGVAATFANIAGARRDHHAYARRMADSWGDDGPPADAYGRHSRDLAALTAEYAAYLQDLPTRLTSEYICQLQEATVDQVDWLLNGSPTELHDVFALDPGDDACATLLVGRGQFEGGATAEIGFGVATRASIPPCFCDACDEDSASLISQTEEYVRIVTAGCVSSDARIEHPWQRVCPTAHGWRSGTSGRAAAGLVQVPKCVESHSTGNGRRGDLAPKPCEGRPHVG